MTPQTQNLLSFRESLLPARGLRILGAVAVGVVLALAASPASPMWILLLFALSVMLVSVWISAKDRTRGLRSNRYAPMRPDAETSVLEGGDVPLPRSWWRNWSTWLPLAYLVICFVVSDTLGATGSPAAGWIFAVLLGCLATGGLLWWWVKDDCGPTGYVPLTGLVRQSPQWRPAGDATAVAAVLYSAGAVPHGRQVRRDTLGSAAADLFDLGEDATTRALGELTGRRELIVTVERNGGGVREEWFSLTPAGVDAVLASFRADRADTAPHRHAENHPSGR